MVKVTFSYYIDGDFHFLYEVNSAERYTGKHTEIHVGCISVSNGFYSSYEQSALNMVTFYNLSLIFAIVLASYSRNLLICFELSHYRKLRIKQFS